jgi:hypothetical protein
MRGKAVPFAFTCDIPWPEGKSSTLDRPGGIRAALIVGAEQDATVLGGITDRPERDAELGFSDEFVARERQQGANGFDVLLGDEHESISAAATPALRAFEAQSHRQGE